MPHSFDELMVIAGLEARHGWDQYAEAMGTSTAPQDKHPCYLLLAMEVGLDLDSKVEEYCTDCLYGDDSIAALKFCTHFSTLGSTLANVYFNSMHRELEARRWLTLQN